MRLIRGKFDSLWKFDLVADARGKSILRRGYFMTPMHYARKVRGGLVTVDHLRHQPWTGWQKSA